jgi:hypothetical protein
MAIPSSGEIEKLYKKHGGNISSMAAELGKCNATVYGWCKRYGLKGQGVGGAKTQAPPYETLKRMHDACGGVVAEMARRGGWKPNTVLKWCTENGLRATGRDQFRSVYPQVIDERVTDGYVLCFSDCHWWFEEKSRAHEALLIVAKKLKPVMVVANGDVLDGARISRHDPSGLDPLPTFADELHITNQHMAEIANATGDARRYLAVGNHDSRMSRYLVMHAPEMDGVDGTRLDHHILGWSFCMSVTINTDVVVKHAFRGGVHATWNNTLHDGRTIVTGHLHSQQVRPFTDAHGIRYGVDLGCLADPSWPQFNYTISNTKNWRSGFAVLEFRKGELLPPMLATVQNNNSVVLQRNEVVLP